MILFLKCASLLDWRGQCFRLLPLRVGVISLWTADWSLMVLLLCVVQNSFSRTWKSNPPPKKTPRWASKTDQCIYPKLSCWGTSGTYYCTHSLHYPLAKFPLWEWPFFFISNRRLFCIIRHANGSKLDAHIHQPNALHLFICKYTVLTQGLQQK